MTVERQKCWEYWGCKVKDGCPVYPKKGTMCYTIAGTLCHGEVQGAYSDKIENCRKCGFYQNVLFGRGLNAK